MEMGIDLLSCFSGIDGMRPLQNLRNAGRQQKGRMSSAEKAFDQMCDVLPFRLLCEKTAELHRRCSENDHELTERVASELRPYLLALKNLGYKTTTIKKAWEYFDSRYCKARNR